MFRIQLGLVLARRCTVITTVALCGVIAPTSAAEPEKIAWTLGGTGHGSGDDLVADVRGAGCGAATLTQSNNPDVIGANSVWCGNLTANAETSLARGFVAPYDLALECVQFGVETNTGAAWPVQVRILQGTPTTPYAQLILLGATTVQIPSGTNTQFFSANFTNLMITSGTAFVVELRTPSRFPIDGGDNGLLSLGCNELGQTAPSYLRAPACGANNFLTFQAIGFGQLSLVMSLGVSATTPGACCLPDGSCAEATQADCTAAGGGWTAGGDCATTGACEIQGDCLTTTEDCCDAIGGTFDGSGSCDDSGCAILPAFNASVVAQQGALQPQTLTDRLRRANNGRGAPQVFLATGVLNVIGTSGPDSFRLRIDPNDASQLQVFTPEDGTGATFTFSIASINSATIQTDDDDDLVFFDDVNGNVAALFPFSLDTGGGDDTILTRSAGLTLANVLSIVTTLDTARNLATQADAIAQAAGAISNPGSGSGDLISEANLLAQQAVNTLVLPTESYITDLTNQLIIPTANAVDDSQAQLIQPALELIQQGYVDVIQVGEQLESDAENDLLGAANQLIAIAENDLIPAAEALEACGITGLIDGEANAFETELRDLMAQIEIIADLCPEKGPEPPEQPDPCPEIQELVDCAETLIEDFLLRVEVCEEDGEALLDDADDFALQAANDLEGPADAYLLAFDNLALAADSYVLAAEGYEAAAEAWIAALETQLESTGAAFDQRAQAEFVAAGDALVATAQSNLETAANQLAADAAALATAAEGIMAAGTTLLDDGSRGGAATCADINTTNTITGGPGANILLGTIGNDLINGLGGPDLIIGGPGDDRLNGGDGVDLIFGGSGTNEIHGNEKLDILIGGNDKDCIFGDEGFDVILGRGGEDELDGGEYIDVILGGDDADEAWGRDGIDVIFGGEGDDTLDGGNCIDVIFGREGDDTLIGGDGLVLTIGSFSIDLGDVIFGGDGDDMIFGDAQSGDGTGIDVIFGGLGADDISAADGGDMTIGSSFTLKLGNLVFGGAGDDAIESKKGIDVLFGGTENDTITADEGDVLSFSSGNFEIELGDLTFGGDGNDTIDSDSEDGTQDIDLIFAGAGDDTVNAYDGGMVTIGSNFTFMLGNLVFGAAGDDALNAGAGLDLIFGGTENDTVEAGDGADLVIGSSFSIKLGDLIFGQAGNDVLHADVPDFNDGVGLDGIDLMFGGDGDDRMYGCGGGLVDFGSVDFDFGNLMFGGPGNDTISGDYEIFDAGNREKGIDLIFGGTGDDNIDAAPGDDITIGVIPNVFFVNLGNIVFGGPGNDTLLTEIGLDLVFCGRGNDSATTGLGIDFIFGSQDDDTISAGDGGLILIPVGVSVPIPLGNFVFGGDGNDDITSEGLITEIDLLFGNKCDDIIRCGNGLIDLAFGNAGDDEIRGEAGVNLLFGNRGDDLIIGGGDLVEFIFGNRDNDTIHAGGSIDIVFGGDGQDDIDGGLGLDLLFGNQLADVIRGNVGIDLIFGNRGGDDLYGDDGLDLVFGNRGKDCLHGGNGGDLLFGGDEDDLVYGDSGLNLCFGNQGNDQLFGGPDVDLAFGGDGADRIDGGGSADLLFGGSSGDVIFGGSGANLIFGGSGGDFIFGGPNFNLAFGGGGNDLIRGGGATDLLFGNDDDDVLYGEAGTDLVFGNRGNDDIDGGADGDILFGNRESDRILLGSGKDFAFGNRDNDNIRAVVSDGSKDYLFGNRGDDTMDRCENNDKRIGGAGSDTKTADCTVLSFGGAAGCGEIVGKVLLDTNGDTTGDEPLPGVTVYIDLNNNGVLNGGEPSTVTLAEDPETHQADAGCYRFTGVSPGSYAIRQIVPSGLTQVSPSGAAGASVGDCTIATATTIVNRDPCRPDPALPNPCENCPCPPGFTPKPIVSMGLACSYDGTPCVQDPDCECGGTCDPVTEILGCECVPDGDDCPPDCAVKIWFALEGLSNPNNTDSAAVLPSPCGSFDSNAIDAPIGVRVYIWIEFTNPMTTVSALDLAFETSGNLQILGGNIWQNNFSPPVATRWDASDFPGFFAADADGQWANPSAAIATTAAGLTNGPISAFDDQHIASIGCSGATLIGSIDVGGTGSLRAIPQAITVVGQPPGSGSICLGCECPCDSGLCPPGALIEEEDNCGPTTLNHGCDAPLFPQFPPAYSPIDCGQTACGTMRGNSFARDTDWWRWDIITGAPERLICIEAEFAGTIELRNGIGCPVAPVLSIPFTAGQKLCQVFFALPGESWTIRVAPLSGELDCSNYTLQIGPCLDFPDGQRTGEEYTGELRKVFSDDTYDFGADNAPLALGIDDFSASEDFDIDLSGAMLNPPNPLLVPPPPHDVPKNRYVSFDSNLNGPRVAIEIIIPPCRRAWVGEPMLVDNNGDDVAWVAEIVADPIYRDWTEDVVHVYGCAVAPNGQYDLTPVRQFGERGDTLTLVTVPLWGDVAGPPSGGVYGPPDGVVNQIDRSAVQDKIAGVAQAPHTTWVDLAPLIVDYAVTNSDDLVAVDGAIAGELFPPKAFGISDIVECELPIVCTGLCGDTNCDSYITVSDIGQFVRAVTAGEAGWRMGFVDSEPPCDFLCANDMNRDGFVTVSDIAFFVQAVVAGDCPQ